MTARLTFEDALVDLCDSDEQDEIRTRLTLLSSSSALGKRAVHNLASESRLRTSEWDKLLTAILGAPAHIDASTLQDVLVTAFRDLILMGATLPDPKPRVLGRAVTTERFCRLLHEHGHFGTVATARTWIHNALGKPVSFVLLKLSGAELGSHLMWGTFNRKTRNNNPFAKRPTKPDALRCLLGLSKKDNGKPLLLMEYTLPPAVPPLIPTVADAYAGGLSYYFEVSLPTSVELIDKGYPSTLPWPECENRGPRPEVVHEVISGDFLSSPLRELP